MLIREDLYEHGGVGGGLDSSLHYVVLRSFSSTAFSVLECRALTVMSYVPSPPIGEFTAYSANRYVKICLWNMPSHNTSPSAHFIELLAQHSAIPTPSLTSQQHLFTQI